MCGVGGVKGGCWMGRMRSFFESAGGICIGGFVCVRECLHD